MVIVISCATFTITSSTGTIVSLNQPHAITDDDDRNIKSFHQWSGIDTIIDDGINTDNITINGTENIDAFTTMQSLDFVTNSGDEVTIAGLGNTTLNTTYQIEDFNYSVNQGEVGITRWSITLEKT